MPLPHVPTPSCVSVVRGALYRPPLTWTRPDIPSGYRTADIFLKPWLRFPFRPDETGGEGVASR
ncbi:hypothetical protein SHJG_4227 [Streptomyces hygroscopicus subsp. jinggangensis 5008]|nr:hypothetical protein SHJG_4227 [Streptomyces hygroscopicus subsp. jinggangensis 5008]AGF63656.1 hypothetical protein SHJGH_3991 [Streptomyces hygroscopicus subsp. jinggangensis TL01]